MNNDHVYSRENERVIFYIRKVDGVRQYSDKYINDNLILLGLFDKHNKVKIEYAYTETDLLTLFKEMYNNTLHPKERKRQFKGFYQFIDTNQRTL